MHEHTYRVVLDPSEIVVYRHYLLNKCAEWIKGNKEKLKKGDLEAIVEEVDEDDNVVKLWQQYDFDIWGDKK